MSDRKRKRRRIEHPEKQLHQNFIDNLSELEKNIKDSSADMVDNLYNFFSQFIRITTGSFTEEFKPMVRKAIYEDYYEDDPRQAAARIIKQSNVEWPDSFLGRVYLSDIRNFVVFELWSQHQHVIDAKWTPGKGRGDEAQNEAWTNALGTIGAKIQNPKDSSRLSNLLTYIHFLKLIHHVKAYLEQKEGEYDSGDNIYTFNTISGACLHKYNNEGMPKLIWELFLDVWHYDNVS